MGCVTRQRSIPIRELLTSQIRFSSYRFLNFRVPVKNLSYAIPRRDQTEPMSRYGYTGSDVKPETKTSTVCYYLSVNKREKLQLTIETSFVSVYVWIFGMNIVLQILRISWISNLSVWGKKMALESGRPADLLPFSKR